MENIRIAIENEEHQIRVQEILFSMGLSWAAYNDDKRVYTLDKKFIMVKDNRMYFCKEDKCERCYNRLECISLDRMTSSYFLSMYSVGETFEKEKELDKSLSKNIERLRDALKIQGCEGIWNCDEYSLGIFNGLEFALSIMENRDPNYRRLTESNQPKETSVDCINIIYEPRENAKQGILNHLLKPPLKSAIMFGSHDINSDEEDIDESILKNQERAYHVKIDDK